MLDSQDDHDAVVFQEEHSIRIAAHESTPDAAVFDREDPGLLPDQLQCPLDLVDELLSQSASLLFVPGFGRR